MKHIKKFNENFQSSEMSKSDFSKEIVELITNPVALKEYLDRYKENDTLKESIIMDGIMSLRNCIKGTFQLEYGPEIVNNRRVEIKTQGKSYYDSFVILFEFVEDELAKNPLGGTIDSFTWLSRWSLEYARIDILEYLKNKGYFKATDTDLKWIQNSRKSLPEEKEKVISKFF